MFTHLSHYENIRKSFPENCTFCTLCSEILLWITWLEIIFKMLFFFSIRNGWWKPSQKMCCHIFLEEPPLISNHLLTVFTLCTRLRRHTRSWKKTRILAKLSSRCLLHLKERPTAVVVSGTESLGVCDKQRICHFCFHIRNVLLWEDAKKDR